MAMSGLTARQVHRRMWRPARAMVLAALGPPDGERRDSVEYMLGLNVIDCDSVD